MKQYLLKKMFKNFNVQMRIAEGFNEDSIKREADERLNKNKK